MKYLALAFALTLTGCASLDAARIVGEQETTIRYSAHSDVQLQAQKNVAACFAKAGTDVQIMACAMLAQSTSMTSTFAGGPAATQLAPTVGENIRAIAPYAAAGYVGGKIAETRTVTQQVPQQVVRPEVITVPAQ